MKTTIRRIREIVQEAIIQSLCEVDLDPSNNPGRPADPYEYLGMHPPANAASSHPYASGGGGATPANPPDGGGDGSGDVSNDVSPDVDDPEAEL